MFEEIPLHNIDKIKKEIRQIWLNFRDAPKKQEIKVSCDLKMLVILILDVYPITRKQWDKKYTEENEDPIEREYKEDNLVILKGNSGYTWWRFDEKNNSYSIYARGIFYWIKKLETDACFIQSNAPIEELQRLAWAANGRGPQIYAKWICGYCVKKEEYPSNVLICPKCYNPRYWKCSELTCQTPQITENVQYCRRCGKKKL